MDEPFRRLLFTEEPHPDESFIGYVLRIAALNEIPDIRWIFRLVTSKLPADSNYGYNFDFKVDTFALSKILGIGEIQLKDLLYVRPNCERKNTRKLLSFYGHPIHQDLINRTLPKICPACLIESNYCRRIWEAAFITACSIHKCLLLAYCPACKYMLEWARPKIHLCHCRFDFRKSKLVFLKDKELRLVNYFYNAFGLSAGNPEVTLGYPLNTLDPERLLKLLYLTRAYYEKNSDYTSYRTGIYRGNEKIHKQLYSAVKVFDNWAVNYHIFVEAWTKKYKKQCLPFTPADIEKFRLPAAYDKYELFNLVIRRYLSKKNYPFLFNEFVNFLRKLPGEDTLESNLLD